VTGWFALVLIVAVVIATAAIFAAGRKAGTAAAPRDRDALADRPRDGRFLSQAGSGRASRLSG
jgi:hypothetical protein